MVNLIGQQLRGSFFAARFRSFVIAPLHPASSMLQRATLHLLTCLQLEELLTFLQLLSFVS